MYCFRKRHIWGSKLHAGYSIPLRFYLEWSAISWRCQKFVSGLIIMGIWQVGRFLTWSLVVVPAIIYHCNAVDSMEHLQRVWHASRERLPFRAPGSIRFWTCICSNCRDRFSKTFTRLCTSNIPECILHFVLLAPERPRADLDKNNIYREPVVILRSYVKLHKAVQKK